MFKKTPARPVVSMPMESRFNEKIAIDLKSWKGKYILHMIDMFTRLSVSVLVTANPHLLLLRKSSSIGLEQDGVSLKEFFLIMVENSIILKCLRWPVFSISSFPLLLLKAHGAMVSAKEITKLLIRCWKS